MMTTQERIYWIHRGGESYGPYTKDETRQYAEPETFVSFEDRWFRLSEHPHFNPKADESQPSATAPPEEPPATTPFYDASGQPDIPAALAYLHESSPDELRQHLPGWNADPTDLLVVADHARRLGYKQHAKVLYAHALIVMEDAPTLIADDTNRTGAYYMYGSILLELDQPREAIEPFAKAATIDPLDAVSWYKLGICQALTGQLEAAAQTFERALSLKGRDKHQDEQFYAAVGEKLGNVKKLIAQRGSGGKPTGRRPPIRDLGEARHHLGRSGIDLRESLIMAPVKKRSWDSPSIAEVCHFEKRGDQYDIVVLNLPYFFGPNWYEQTGGNPQTIECGSIDEMVQVLETAIADRMVDGYLPIPS